MYLILSASPNTDGLTAACVEAALAGFADAGAQARHYNLCKLSIARCMQCGNGWGQCLTDHLCVISDDIGLVQRDLGEELGVVIVTPVYYGEMAESAKCLFDRLRRCEATRGEASALAGKPVLAVAAAGGSGNGVASCLASMERLTQHLRGQVADLIGITRRSRAYKLETIHSAAIALTR